MKKIPKYFSVLAIILAILGCEQQSKTNPGYQITGQIKDVSDSTLVKLYKIDTRIQNAISQKPIDSAYITNNQFSFKGELSNPSLMLLAFDNPETNNRYEHRAIPMVLDNSTTTIDAHYDSTPKVVNTLETGAYTYKNVQITGTKLQLGYENYLKLMHSYQEEWNNLFMGSYLSYLRNKKRDTLPISQGIDIVSKIDHNQEDKKVLVLNFIKENADNVLSTIAANDVLELLNVEELENLHEVISNGQLENELKMEFLNRISGFMKVAPGSNFMDFDFKTPEGETVKLSNFLGNGNYVLLEFWASWCGPCRADIPHIKEVYELYNPEGFEVVSVSMDHKNDAWLKALEEEQMPWTQISDGMAFNGELAKAYNIRGIPTCLLIDPDGKIVTRNMRGSWMDKRLIEMYGNKFE